MLRTRGFQYNPLLRTGIILLLMIWAQLCSAFQEADKTSLGARPTQGLATKISCSPASYVPTCKIERYCVRHDTSNGCATKEQACSRNEPHRNRLQQVEDRVQHSRGFTNSMWYNLLRQRQEKVSVVDTRVDCNSECEQKDARVCLAYEYRKVCLICSCIRSYSEMKDAAQRYPEYIGKQDQGLGMQSTLNAGTKYEIFENRFQHRYRCLWVPTNQDAITSSRGILRAMNSRLSWIKARLQKTGIRDAAQVPAVSQTEREQSQWLPTEPVGRRAPGGALPSMPNTIISLVGTPSLSLSPTPPSPSATLVPTTPTMLPTPTTTGISTVLPSTMEPLPSPSTATTSAMPTPMMPSPSTSTSTSSATPHTYMPSPSPSASTMTPPWTATATSSCSHTKTHSHWTGTMTAPNPPPPTYMPSTQYPPGCYTGPPTVMCTCVCSCPTAAPPSMPSTMSPTFTASALPSVSQSSATGSITTTTASASPSTTLSGPVSRTPFPSIIVTFMFR
ncbi:hypothetical protein CYME_CMO001C [Cyanidioschyzon merolae strain 10D]|uniref:Uncharacterized protein n=1 Tax=Cyanidioschyzon merolae (strain NIES-3377 / 10D) TaxID=280699 RepID=M1V5X0_CYAM1|nr:hypothetical protein CYME_CMO001C [Cyanidioschyzon merolae strain 10D]BAM81405.1 hypothetical protein CYME_CMO001C [Cyanidioschyzon merolae strain 10D]|eukprot:XP_005537441.1 hypothetical protein CYME_CMO001C [Cyanidioschyzon merolae strain 10D]